MSCYRHCLRLRPFLNMTLCGVWVWAVGCGEPNVAVTPNDVWQDARLEVSAGLEDAAEALSFSQEVLQALDVDVHQLHGSCHRPFGAEGPVGVVVQSLYRSATERTAMCVETSSSQTCGLRLSRPIDGLQTGFFVEITFAAQDGRVITESLRCLTRVE